MTRPNRQAVAERAQCRQCGGLRLSEGRVGKLEASECTSARGDSLDGAIRKRGHVRWLSIDGARAATFFWKVVSHAALVILGDQRSLVFVAPVQTRQLEGERRVVEE